jgi:hypothetical protein
MGQSHARRRSGEYHAREFYASIQGKPWPLTKKKIATMMNLRAVLASTSIVLWLSGCGPSASAPDAAPSVAVKPDVIVTLDGEHHTCLVALSTEAQGSSIGCDEVVPFVRDELRVPSGSIYDLRTLPRADQAEVAKVEASLKGAGYRSGATQGHR